MADASITVVRAVTDEMVEKAARAGYEAEASAWGCRGGWDALTECEKQDERDHARIMLVAAVTPPTSRKEPSGG